MYPLLKFKKPVNNENWMSVKRKKIYVTMLEKKLLSPFKNFEMFSILKLLFPFKYVEMFSFLRLPWEKFFSETISLIFFG